MRDNLCTAQPALLCCNGSIFLFFLLCSRSSWKLQSWKNMGLNISSVWTVDINATKLMHYANFFWDKVTKFGLPFLEGTGVAFAPKPSWVAFAPKWRGMKWVQGRMWPSFRGECDPCFCVAGAIVSEPQKDFFHPREWYSRVFLRSNSHFNQLPGHYACYGVPLLRCNIHFEQLPRRFGCYLPRDISINF